MSRRTATLAAASSCSTRSNYNEGHPERAHASRGTCISERLIQLPTHTLGHLRQFCPRILQKMRRLTVCLQCRLILILFVDEKLARTFLVFMYLEHQAPGLLA